MPNSEHEGLQLPPATRFERSHNLSAARVGFGRIELIVQDGKLWLDTRPRAMLEPADVRGLVCELNARLAELPEEEAPVQEPPRG